MSAAISPLLYALMACIRTTLHFTVFSFHYRLYINIVIGEEYINYETPHYAIFSSILLLPPPHFPSPFDKTLPSESCPGNNFVHSLLRVENPASNVNSTR
jgi:hypothetical protein